MGFKPPASWRRILLIALAAAALRILLGEFVIEPLTGVFWPEPAAPALANEITGNMKIAALALLVVWTFAAFGEEIAYRGYLLTRAADIWMEISSGLLDRNCAGFNLVWLWALLQRHLWCNRFWSCRIDFWESLT